MISRNSGAVHRAPRSVFPIPPELIGHIEPRAVRDPAFRAAINQEWPKLLVMLDDLAELYDEVPIVDFVPVLQAVTRLSSMGVQFDDLFLARLDEMRLSIIGTDEDDDHDDADSFLDLEDSDDDADEDGDFTDDAASNW